MTEPYRVFKYPVSLTDAFELEMPAASCILDVQVQRDQPVMWAMVNPANPSVTRRFRLVGTGHPITLKDRRRMTYVATFQLAYETLAMHLFEVDRVEVAEWVGFDE